MGKAGTGNFLEDFRVGQEIRHATPRTLTEGDAALYLALTGSRFAQNCCDPLARANGLPTAYEELWRWSVEDVERFWRTIWTHYRVSGGEPGTVLADPSMPGARWFPDERVNFAAHIFRDRDPETVAIRHASESRPLAECTWGELASETARIRDCLERLGLLTPVAA